MSTQVQQPEPTPLEKKQRKQREIVTADEWGKILSKWQRATESERRTFAKEKSYEISIQDIRDRTVDIVHETFGRGDSAFLEVEARNGANHRTIKKWEDKSTLRPQMAKIRQVLRTCDHDIGIIAYNPRGRN